MLAGRGTYLTVTQHARTLIAPKRTFIRGLALACLLLAVCVAQSRAQNDADAHTLLLLRFENSLAGAGGETQTDVSGVTFEEGILGQGVLIDNSDFLRYATAGNFNAPEGTIEFWVKPRSTQISSAFRHFFSVRSGADSFAVFKDPVPSVRFVINADDSEAGRRAIVFSWMSNQWHHVAVTWTIPGRMITYLDGVEVVNHPSGSQDLISQLPAEFDIGSRGGASNSQANAVLDELRISDVARTPQEIAARYHAALPVTSLSLGVPTRTLWKTWRVPVTLAAETSLGTRNPPPSAAVWSSSDPGVATVDPAAGRIVAVGAGSAILTATLNGAQASLNVTVRAPLREPRVEVPSGYLSTPAAGALYQVPVVIFRYLPTADGTNLDVAWSPDFYTLNPIPLSQLEHSLNLYDPTLKFMLEEGSRFRGYGSQVPPPSLGYRVAAVITVYEPAPPGKVTRVKQGFPMYDADWFQIFERFGMRDYVNEQGVKEVWFYWGGVQPEIPSYDPAIHPPENMREGWESNMASPTTGDISNSNQDNTDLPLYDKTYIVHGRNIRRLDPTTIHGDGHQLESMMTFANRRQAGNTELFWQKFAGLTAAGAWQRGRGGDTHHPPNALDHYDYDNASPFDSDIMDWKPDGGGQSISYTSTTHRNAPYQFPNDFFLGANVAEPHWHIFWRQSMPGRGSAIPYGVNRLTNWWHFVGDWDAAFRAGLGLYEPGGCSYALSANGQSFAAGGGAGGVSVAAGGDCRWMAASNAPWVKITSGDTSNGGNATVNFSVAPNTTYVPRAATLAVAGQTYTVTQAPAPPLLLSAQDSQRAAALASVTSLRDPFQLFTAHNFSQDQRTRVMLFAAGVELAPGEGISAVTAQAEDAQQRVFPVTVEYVGKVTGFDWLTQINLRLPDGLANAGDVWVSISLRGVPSNKAVFSIGPPP